MGSTYRVCSFCGQVHTVYGALPGTFSVTVTFPARRDILCTATEDLRHPCEMRKLQKGESTKFPSVYANHPAISGGEFTTYSLSHWTKNYQVSVGEKQAFLYLLYLHGEYLFSLNPQSNIRQLGCEWNNDQTNCKSRSFPSTTMTAVDGRCFTFSSVAAVNHPDRKQSRGEWVYSADNSRPLPTIVGKSDQEREASISSNFLI